MKELILNAILVVAIFLSALKVVEVRYQTRLLVVRLEELRQQRDELEREWGQLLLEQGTWNTHTRVEEISRARLGMTIPDPTTLKRVPM